MKNYIRLISLVFIIAFTLILTSTVVRAGEVSSINVEVKNKSIVVSGTAEAGRMIADRKQGKKTAANSSAGYVALD